MTCTENDVIYVIECRGCRKYYIGETSNLRNRVTLHIRHKNLRMIPSCSKFDPKYFIFPFYKMKNSSRIDRKEKEKQFIKNYARIKFFIKALLCRDARRNPVIVITKYRVYRTLYIVTSELTSFRRYVIT